MAKLTKICVHWTAGTNQPNSTDYQHYHYLINGDGLIFKGKYKPEDNLDCNDGKYAQHCGGGNTGAIGVSMCGMFTPKGTDFRKSPYPLTKKQCESCFNLIAELCVKYNIPVTKDTVYTHYEFGQRHSKTTSYGKIDITYLPPYPQLNANQVGDFIRNKVKWYINKNV